ncbi:MAG TPA: aminoglycoside phosphotransferase, partial [Erythrobacter sp.]|nr:aminoglycoside phosphotransferase [Erythrobacter sp.]
MSDALPEGIHNFLGNTEWEGAEIAPLVGDASFRRYFRLRMGGKTAMLMHAPPPHEDPKPFLQVAHWLEANGMRAPHILAESAPEG